MPHYLPEPARAAQSVPAPAPRRSVRCSPSTPSSTATAWSASG